MKRLITIFMIFMIFILLPSCVYESKCCNLSLFGERINKIYNNEVFRQEEIEVIKYNGEIKAYWFPDDNENACVSFLLNNNTGNIERCSIVFNNNKFDEKLYENVSEAIEYNNEYIKESKYKSGDMYMISLTDSRYEKESNDKTLKKEIKEEDLY